MAVGWDASKGVTLRMHERLVMRRIGAEYKLQGQHQTTIINLHSCVLEPKLDAVMAL